MRATLGNAVAGLLAVAMLGLCGCSAGGGDADNQGVEFARGTRQQLVMELIRTQAELARIEAGEPDRRLSAANERQALLEGELAKARAAVDELNGKKGQLLREIDVAGVESAPRQEDKQWHERMRAVSLLLDEAQLHCVALEQELMTTQDLAADLRRQVARREALNWQAQRLTERIKAIDDKLERQT